MQTTPVLPPQMSPAESPAHLNVALVSTYASPPLAAGDMSDEAGAAIQKELGAAVHFAKCNVTDEVSVKAALAAGLARFGGKLHGVVNSGMEAFCEFLRKCAS